MAINGLKKLSLGLIYISFLLSWSNSAESEISPVSETCNLVNTAFQSGEELVYKVYYNWNFVWLPAGEVILRAQKDNGLYKLRAYGRTYKTYEWFYKLRYDYECEIDTSTLLPKKVYRRINEKKYSRYDEIHFNQQRQRIVSHRGRTKDQTRRRTYHLKPCTHDLLSLIYFARNMDMNDIEKGREETFNIFYGKKTWRLKAQYESRDSTKRIKKLGQFDTLHFTSEVMEGKVFKKGSRMQIWISNDANRIPLLIEAPLSAGAVKVVLKDYQCLRNEFNSKLESSKK